MSIAHFHCHYRATRMHSVARCPSVRLSVRLSVTRR